MARCIADGGQQRFDALIGPRARPRSVRDLQRWHARHRIPTGGPFGQATLAALALQVVLDLLGLRFIYSDI